MSEDPAEPKRKPKPKVEKLVRHDGSEAWRQRLITYRVAGPHGGTEIRLKKCATNVLTLGTWHESLRGLFATDDFSGQIVLQRPPPWSEESGMETEGRELRETDVMRLVDWLEREEGLTMGAQMVGQAIAVLAEKNHAHPLRSYLDCLRWDGKQRLPTWLTDYCGVIASDYASQIGKRWMISAVARARRPGCQADCVLILQGRSQGRGKSNAFRALCPNPNWYTETSTAIGSKDGYQALGGKWIVLLDELDSLRRGEVTRVKSFLTAVQDSYRPPYARLFAQFLRQNVFGGTTNEETPLVDRTGNRRFWIAQVGEQVDFARIAADRDQLWAEAVARFDSGENWWVDSDKLRELCEEQQQQHVGDDDWTTKIARWAAQPEGKPGGPSDRSIGLTTYEVLCSALGKEPGDITRADTMRAAECLKELGYLDVHQVLVDGRRQRYYRMSCTTAQPKIDFPSI